MGGPKTSPTVFECLRGWSRADTCRRALAWLQHWAFACQLLFGGRSRAARQPMTRLQRLVFCIMRQGRFAEHASRLLRFMHRTRSLCEHRGLSSEYMRLVVPVQLGEACERWHGALGIRVPVAFRWSFPCSSAADDTPAAACVLHHAPRSRSELQQTPAV